MMEFIIACFDSASNRGCAGFRLDQNYISALLVTDISQSIINTTVCLLLIAFTDLYFPSYFI